MPTNPAESGSSRTCAQRDEPALATAAAPPTTTGVRPCCHGLWVVPFKAAGDVDTAEFGGGWADQHGTSISWARATFVPVYVATWSR